MKSVKDELSTMFEDQSQLDQIKLQMIVYQYKNETPLFQMIFDKRYRLERYQAINDLRYKYRNKAAFKSDIFTNHSVFPMKAAYALDTFYRRNKGFEQSEDLDRNVLIENKFMNHFNAVYKCEIIYKVEFALGMLYLGYSGLKRNINYNILFGAFMFPGFVLNAFAMYSRKHIYMEYDD